LDYTQPTHGKSICITDKNIFHQEMIYETISSLKKMDVSVESAMHEFADTQ